MNYLFFLGNISGRGGTEKACITVANKLSEIKENKVYIVVYNNSEETSYYSITSSVNVCYLNCANWKVGYPLIVIRTIKLMKRLKITHFISVEMYSLLFTIPVFWISKLLFYNVKFIVWEHYNYNVSLNKWFRRYARKWSFRHADKIVLLTISDLDVWQQHLGYNNKLVVIPNGIELNNVENVYDKDSRVILAVGRFDPIKRFDLLIDIWKICLQKYGDLVNGWEVNLIGVGSMKESYFSKIKELSIQDTFIIKPFTKYIEDEYKKGGVLCLTSEYEGFGLVLLEAQIFGIPQVSFDCPVGPREIISEGKTGFLIEDNNIEMFAYRLVELISDVEKRKQFSQSSYENSKKYDVNKIIKKWEAL